MRCKMNKFTLLEGPWQTIEKNEGEIGTFDKEFSRGLDQPEPGLRHKMSNNDLRLGYYAASATLRCGS